MRGWLIADYFYSFIRNIHLSKVNIGGSLVPTEAHLFVCNFDMALKAGSVIDRMALWDCISGTSFDPLSRAPF